MTGQPPVVGPLHGAPQWWRPVVYVLLSAYMVLTIAVLVGSPMNSLDAFWYQQHLVPKDSPWFSTVSGLVFIGRRLPATIIVGVYALHRTIRTRSWKPAVMLTFAWFAFNATVGSVKYLTGRIGPRYTADAHTLFAGGDIFPSGHVTGAVVLYGVAAMMAPIAYRKVLAVFAVAISVIVGFGTVALNTHWLSDVFGAWIDGTLVLLVTWAITPWAVQWTEYVVYRSRVQLRRWRATVAIAARSTSTSR